jgi:hypothetical protein
MAVDGATPSSSALTAAAAAVPDARRTQRLRAYLRNVVTRLADNAAFTLHAREFVRALGDVASVEVLFEARTTELVSVGTAAELVHALVVEHVLRAGGRVLPHARELQARSARTTSACRSPLHIRVVVHSSATYTRERLVAALGGEQAAAYMDERALRPLLIGLERSDAAAAEALAPVAMIDCAEDDGEFGRGRELARACKRCVRHARGNATLLQCARCRKTCYCSAACQRDDWRWHRDVCRAAVDANAVAATEASEPAATTTT